MPGCRVVVVVRFCAPYVVTPIVEGRRNPESGSGCDAWPVVQLENPVWPPTDFAVPPVRLSWPAPDFVAAVAALELTCTLPPVTVTSALLFTWNAFVALGLMAMNAKLLALPNAPAVALTPTSVVPPSDGRRGVSTRLEADTAT